MLRTAKSETILHNICNMIDNTSNDIKPVLTTSNGIYNVEIREIRFFGVDRIDKTIDTLQYTVYLVAQDIKRFINDIIDEYTRYHNIKTVERIVFDN